MINRITAQRWLLRLIDTQLMGEDVLIHRTEAELPIAIRRPDESPIQLLIK